MKKVAVIIVGVGQWEEYTKPLIKSIRLHEPGADILVCDNGNTIPYVEKMNADAEFVVVADLDDLPLLEYQKALKAREGVHKPVCYARAINISVGRSIYLYDPDWYVIMNNDVICDGPFLEYVSGLDRDFIYGNKIHNKNHKKFTSPTDFIDGWIYVVPSKVYKSVGQWDEGYKIAGFEDADYSIRCYESGFGVRKSQVAFTHLEEHIRTTFDNYKKHRLDNMDYLIRKHGLERK